MSTLSKFDPAWVELAVNVQSNGLKDLPAWLEPSWNDALRTKKQWFEFVEALAREMPAAWRVMQNVEVNIYKFHDGTKRWVFSLRRKHRELINQANVVPEGDDGLPAFPSEDTVSKPEEGADKFEELLKARGIAPKEGKE